jgi:hypothetical protein
MSFLRAPAFGVLTVLAFPSLSGCQGGDSTTLKAADKKLLSASEEDRLRIGFDLLESESKEISEIEHRYFEMTNGKLKAGDPEALQLTPEQYAKMRREKAVEELVRVLMDRGIEIRKEKTELMNTIKSDSTGIFAK